MPAQIQDERLDWLRGKAVEAWFERAPEADIERIIADVEREYGPAEAANLRADLEQVRATIPNWLRYLSWEPPKLPLWKTVMLCIGVFLAALLLSIRLNGGF